jgi:hypothetical protein
LKRLSLSVENLMVFRRNRTPGRAYEKNFEPTYVSWTAWHGEFFPCRAEKSDLPERASSGKRNARISIPLHPR